MEVQDRIYRSDKNFGKELNFRGYISQLWRLVRTVWFNTSSFSKSNVCSLIMSQASMCLCIIYMLDLMTASETKPQAYCLKKKGLGVDQIMMVTFSETITKITASMNRIKKQSCAFSEQQRFCTAVVLLSAGLQTVIGPPEDSCLGGGTFDNLSTTCSCSQVKPQQRKCPGYHRKQLPTPVELLHRLTILRQMPGRPKC